MMERTPQEQSRFEWIIVIAINLAFFGGISLWVLLWCIACSGGERQLILYIISHIMGGVVAFTTIVYGHYLLNSWLARHDIRRRAR